MAEHHGAIPSFRDLASAPGQVARCFCCKAEFVFTVDSGGLCDTCNNGDCPRCQHDGDWMET